MSPPLLCAQGRLLGLSLKSGAQAKGGGGGVDQPLATQPLGATPPWYKLYWPPYGDCKGGFDPQIPLLLAPFG